MYRRVLFLTCVVGCAASAPPAVAGSASASPAVAGSASAPPAQVIVLQGRGVQVYACTQAEAAYEWRLKAPDAMLVDAKGHVVGRHFAGPSWQARDGSAVVGKAVAMGGAPQHGAVAWLVLTAKSHSGKGMFAAVSYIVRSATQGGAAPATGCDASHAGAEQRVGYSATYTFFSG